MTTPINKISSKAMKKRKPMNVSSIPHEDNIINEDYPIKENTDYVKTNASGIINMPLKCLSDLSEQENSRNDNRGVHHDKKLEKNFSSKQTDNTCHDNIYKCNVCNMSFEFRSSLIKHKKKVHFERKDDSTLVNPMEISDDKIEYGPLLNTKVKKVKNKKAIKDTKKKTLSPKEMENNTLQTMCDTNKKKKLKNYIARTVKDDKCYEKIYSCDLCEKSFEYIPLLNKHKRKTHNVHEDLSTVTEKIGDNIGIGEPLLNTTVEKVKKRKSAKKSQLEVDDNLENAKVPMNKSCNDTTFKCNLLDESATPCSTNLCDDNIKNEPLLNTIVKKVKKRKTSKESSIKILSPKKKKKKTQQTVCDTDHNKKLDKDITSSVMDKSPNDKIYKCDVCEKSYEFISSLNKHKKKTHSLEKDECTTNSSLFSSLEDDEEYTSLLKKHIKKLKKKKKISNMAINLVKIMPFNNTKNQETIYEPCNQYIDSYNAEDYSYKPSNSKIFKCNICKNSFKLLSHLNEHKKKHITKKDFSRRLCNRTFKFANSLSVHKSIHSEKNPKNVNDCNICSKSFFSKSDFDRHIKSHTEVKPFACNECGATFTRKSTMLNHNKIHTGEKPFTCNICESKFSLNKYLAIHYRVHTGDKPYKCNVCSKMFARKSNFNYHNRIHTGEKPYDCRLCEMSFRSSSNRLVHTRKMHNFI